MQNYTGRGTNEQDKKTGGGNGRARKRRKWINHVAEWMEISQTWHRLEKGAKGAPCQGARSNDMIQTAAVVWSHEIAPTALFIYYPKIIIKKKGNCDLRWQQDEEKEVWRERRKGETISIVVRVTSGDLSSPWLACPHACRTKMVVVLWTCAIQIKKSSRIRILYIRTRKQMSFCLRQTLFFVRRQRQHIKCNCKEGKRLTTKCLRQPFPAESAD